MPTPSALTLEKKPPTRRRRRKSSDPDLERITENVLAGELNPDEHLRNKSNMQRLVDELVDVRLRQIMAEVRQSYNDIADVRELIERMAFLKKTLVTNAQIDTKAREIQLLKQRSYCTEEAITKYIVRSFNNKNRKKYGIVARIDAEDIVIVVDTKMSRKQINESMDEL